MQCDAVLLNGNVIVNESLLTGESLPITKIPLEFNLSSSQKLSLNDHSRHILFCGTQVIQARSGANECLKAIVIRTGFNTVKGELIRSILHPKPIHFQFNNDIHKYVAGLFMIASIGLIYSVTLKIKRGNPVGEIIKRSLDIFIICVPPALPGALTACLAYAQSRLKKKQIYCISPSSINLCGTLNTVVFDKTGTLTEDGLDLKYVLPVNSATNSFEDLIETTSELSIQSKLLRAMTTCHSLTRIHSQLLGDPLDLKMFEFTKWSFFVDTHHPVVRPPLRKTLKKAYKVYTKSEEALLATPLLEENNDPEENSSCEMSIIRQFPFSSALQRMSVIVKVLNEPHYSLFAKGSPEKICELSRKETSKSNFSCIENKFIFHCWKFIFIVPSNFQSVLNVYTSKGYRVVAVGTRKVDVSLDEVNKIERFPNILNHFLRN